MTDESRKRMSEGQRRRRGLPGIRLELTELTGLTESEILSRSLEIFRNPSDPRRAPMIATLKPIMLDLLDKQKAKVMSL